MMEHHGIVKGDFLSWHDFTHGVEKNLPSDPRIWFATVVDVIGRFKLFGTESTENKSFLDLQGKITMLLG